MPKGPNGDNRPAEAIGLAMMIGNLRRAKSRIRGRRPALLRNSAHWAARSVLRT